MGEFSKEKIPAKWYAGTSPAAGAEYSVTVPAGSQWVVHGVFLVFDADSNVANRIPALRIGDGVNVIFEKTFGIVTQDQVARLVAWNPVKTDDTTGTYQLIEFPFPVTLPAGSLISTSTTDIQVGDDWTIIKILMEDCPR